MKTRVRSACFEALMQRNLTQAFYDRISMIENEECDSVYTTFFPLPYSRDIQVCNFVSKMSLL